MVRVRRMSILGIIAMLSVFAIPPAISNGNSVNSWTKVPDSSSGNQSVSALDCYTASKCVALSALNDDVFLSSDTGHSWSVYHSIKSLGQQSGLTCTIAGVCFLYSSLWSGFATSLHYDGIAIAKSLNGGKKWRQIYASKVPPERGQYPTFFISSISCPTSSDCFVIDGTSSTSFILTTTNGGKTWIKSSAPKAFGAIACPTTKICYAVDGVNGSGVYKSTNATRSWAPMPVPANYLRNPNYSPVKSYSVYTISCQSVTWCVAGGMDVTTSNSVASYPVVWGMANGSSWLFGGGIDTSSNPAYYKSYIPSSGLSCPAKNYCLAATSYGAIIDVTFINHKLEVSQDGYSPSSYSSIAALSCPTKSVCVDADRTKYLVPRFGVLTVAP